MLGPPDRGGLEAQKLAKIAESKRPLERRRWLGYWQGSSQPRRRRERDSPGCVDIQRQCGPLRMSARSGRQSTSGTSALLELRLKWACSPICPPRVCASSSREQSFSLVHCLWLAWRCFVGFFGFGLARSLGFMWGMFLCPCGSGFGIPKLVRRAGSHAPYRPGRIDIARLCFRGQKPRACGRETT